MNTDNATPGTWKNKGTMVSDCQEKVDGMRLITNEFGELVAFATPKDAPLIAKAKVNAELVEELVELARQIILAKEEGDELPWDIAKNAQRLYNKSQEAAQ